MALPDLARSERPTTALRRDAVDDTNAAPWMTMPEFQFYLIQLLGGIHRLCARRQGLRRHISGELGVRMPKPEEAGALTLGPDLFVAEADDELRTTWDVVAERQPLGGLGLQLDKPPWLRAVDDAGRLRPSPEREAARAAAAEAEVARLRARLEGREGEAP